MEASLRTDDGSPAIRGNDSDHKASEDPLPTCPYWWSEISKRGIGENRSGMDTQDSPRHIHDRFHNDDVIFAEKINEGHPQNPFSPGKHADSHVCIGCESRQFSRESTNTNRKSVQFEEDVSVMTIPREDTSEAAVKPSCLRISHFFKKRESFDTVGKHTEAGNEVSTSLIQSENELIATNKCCERKSTMTGPNKLTSILNKKPRTARRHERRNEPRRAGCHITNPNRSQRFRCSQSLAPSSMLAYNSTVPLLSKVLRWGQTILQCRERNTVPRPNDVDGKRCPFCLVMVYNEDLLSHLLEHEQEDGVAKGRCVLCQKTIEDLGTIREHYIMFHSGCPFCRKRFFARLGARIHIIRCERKDDFHQL